MAKGQSKKKKAKKDVFTVYLRFNGVFTSNPMRYAQGDLKELNDTNFDEMSFEHLTQIATKLGGSFKKIYYCQTGVELVLGIREIKSTEDIAQMLKLGYETGNEIDMYLEHYGYDIMEIVKSENIVEQNQVDTSDDDYDSDEGYEVIENVDFYSQGDENVVIKSITSSDPFLTKLCSSRIFYKGVVVPQINEPPLVDPDDQQLPSANKVINGVHYPAFNPDIPWDKMEPIVGMRFENPHQLKLALANYGVANGFQLWFLKNDWRELLVYCSRNVAEGRCAGKKGNKHRVMKNKVMIGTGQAGAKGKKKLVKKKKVVKKNQSNSGEGTSQSPKWTKKQIIKVQQDVVCPFRLYASWMSNEHSFQIKSLNSEHKCCRNYNMGSLVTFRWIALHFFKEIIEDPAISLRKMRAEIRKKFMIDVSPGQCRRAKQLALFDHEGDLI